MRAWPATPRRLGFGAHAGAYERARPAWPAEAARWLAPGAPRLVVELGAGTGKLTRALVAPGREVVAVEPDERMLAVLRGLEPALQERIERVVDGEPSLRRGTRLALPFVVDAYRAVAAP